MSGIGPKTTESLKRKHGIESIGQIISVGDEVEMLRKFGDLGKFFYRIISGKGRTVIKPIDTYGAKSISNGRTVNIKTNQSMTPLSPGEAFMQHALEQGRVHILTELRCTHTSSRMKQILIAKML